MIKAFQNAFKIPELRKRLIFTALLLIVYRLGAHITLPGIDDVALEAFFKQLMERGGNVIGFIDLFSGGAFSQMTIFALGIQPYISAVNYYAASRCHRTFTGETLQRTRRQKENYAVYTVRNSHTQHHPRYND